MKKIRKVLTINQRGIFLDRATRVIEKQVKREYLRDLCREYNIKFNLRERKYSLAKKVCNKWLLDDNIIPIKELTLEAEKHWRGRIEVKDRHRPEYYKRMLHLSQLVLETINQIEG